MEDLELNGTTRYRTFSEALVNAMKEDSDVDRRLHIAVP